MGELGAVPKNGKNNFQNYAYLAHADLMKALHPLLVKNGLVIFPKRVRVDTAVGHELRNGEKVSLQNRVVCEVHYVITDGTSEIEFGGIGEGVDSQDKSAYKAQTGAHKYALKGLFCIPDELDAEDERFEEKARDPKENGQKSDGESTQKAGKARANSLREYMDANLLSEDVANAVLEKYKASTFEFLPASVADKMIATYQAQDAKLSKGKK